MKRIVGFFIMLLLSSVGMAGGEDNGVSWNIDAIVSGAKVLSGGLNVYDKPFFKTVLTANLSDGYFADVYHSTALQGDCFENPKCGSVQEWDGEVGKLSKLGPFTILTMVSYFVLGNKEKKDALQGRIKTMYDLGEGLPTVYADVKWVDLVGDQQKGGFMTHVGLGGVWKLTPQISVPAWADITHDGLPFENNGFLFRAGLGLRYNFSPKFHLEAGVDGNLLGNNFSDRTNELVLRMGMSHSF